MAERIKAAERSQLTFSQNVSHELRTPLMSTLVDDILFISKMDKQAQFPMEDIKLFHLVEDSLPSFKGIAQQ